MSSFRIFNQVSGLQRLLARFGRDKRGNVAVIFAITLLPMLGLVGAAVDYARANNARTALQTALDTTALMISKDAAGLTASQIQTRAQQYFNALYTHSAEAPVSNFTAVYSANTGGGSSIILTANSAIQTDFMKVLGSQFNQINLNGATTTKWGSTKLRVALALDNTGSMSDSGKIGALRTAATNLVTQLSATATNSGDVMISLVPFAKDVNVGSSNYQQFWVKWSGQSDTWDENNGSCSKSGYTTKSTCQAQGSCSISSKSTQSSCTSAGSCSISGYSTQSDCQSAGVCSKSPSSNTTQSKCTKNGGTWTTGVWTAGVWTNAVWTPSSHSKWNGCVTDRDQDYDIAKTAPDSSNSSTLFPAEQYSACPASVMPLSSDWTSLKNAIAAMQPNGGTNQAIGMAWGWLSLIQANPLNAPAEDSNYQWSHVIILLSDGLNTQDRWPSYGNGNTQSTCSGSPCIDARQQKLCDNIKAVKDSNGNSLYTIYTIQVNTGSDPTSSVLQYCASDPSKFFMLTTANQIITTFDSIGTQLAKLRITQ
ncbi:MAG: pilus assembly protein TadG [Bradyrhizobiaceae bacterium]|nr:MAG: pilus assembly protein TadG [Bradyrhizobiaceae bacterium]